MKSILRLITLALLPLWSSHAALAQAEPPSPPPVPELKGGEDDATKSAGEARQQLERARKELDRARARQEMDRAGLGASFSDRLQNIIKRTTEPGPGLPAKPMVIRSSPMDAQAQANLEEDLAIMARVLDKALEELPGPQGPYTAMGIDVFTTGSAPMRDFYLDGYGAVFMLHVGFPLLPPPTRPAEQNKAESQSDSTWEQAKEELYGQAPAGLPAAPAEEFSEAKVDQLRTHLLEALKSASNIRQLKPEDSVTVCVSGGPARGRVHSGVRVHATAPPSAPKAPRASTWVVASGGTSGQHATMMTIRARKSDIDAFAQGRLDREQFAKTVSTETYPAAAGGPVAAGAVMSGFGTGGQF